MKILFVGESAVVQTIEFKGSNDFSGVRYAMSPFVVDLFQGLGHLVERIPCHEVWFRFPRTLEALSAYDAVFFSDVGTDTFLLLPDMYREGHRAPNLLDLVRQYVEVGGGFGMIGGYMTFMGMEGKARYRDTVIEEILPVTLMPTDDRREIPEGADLTCEPGSHPILEGLPAKWPHIFGYNKVFAKPGATVPVSFRGDPILALSTYGKGRTLAYTPDIAPHWASKQMLEWPQYPKLWDNTVKYLGGTLG